MNSNPKPRLKQDWNGRYVRLKARVKNGAGTVFDKGEVMRVTRNWKGLHLERLYRCAVCGHHFFQSLMCQESDVELLPPDYALPIPRKMIVATPELIAALKLAIDEDATWSPIREAFSQALKEIGESG